eukprot:TRINITY_DN6452_c0_g1_i2.p1 TRINITY_DN6452_c0_g1~~TRINITY_DN6452_c0_g1_i2.p1  ORF type:complete len:163 (-),score=31.81 TRINITY_DN6452_c0_g1_i2:119-607(-)
MQQLYEFYDELHPEFKPEETENLEKADETKETLTVDASEWMLSSEREKAQTVPTENYACKNCRSILFNSNDLRPHEKGAGNTAFGWGKRENGIVNDVDCFSHFLEEMPWMGNCNDTEGKLFCPKCSGKIGCWSWSGAQCSCGTWCSPAFQVTKARVDCVKTR